jgi:ADP-ribosylglycohydrolase
VAGALYGLAIGDGMGAPVEGWTPERVRERFARHDFLTFLPPTQEQYIGTNRGKGDGRITDDSLLLEALTRSYLTKQDHLDAYDFAALFVPEYAERRVFVPERQEEMTTLERPLWYPERYSHIQHSIYHAEPRRAGLGNRETQSFAGYVMPIGAVNAGDPRGAYDEAIAFGMATQSSYGLEAGAVTAASFAAALAADATPARVVEAALDLAKDGTKRALESVLPEITPGISREAFIGRTRRAYLPYSGLIATAQDEPNANAQEADVSSYGQPSRTVAIENPIVALAALKWSQGDFMRALTACVFYGQDCESIAAHAAGLCGALGGADSVPLALRLASDAANQRDRVAAAASLVSVARLIQARDIARIGARGAALSA